MWRTMSNFFIDYCKAVLLLKFSGKLGRDWTPNDESGVGPDQPNDGMVLHA